MSKYIYYQAAETPKFAEIVNKQKANSNLNNGLDNSRKTPKPKLSKVTGEFDKPYMNIRKNLLEKLNQYEVDMAGRYDEPEVNATIEDYKRQIIDLGKFSSGEAQAYEFLSTSVQNPYDDEGNLLYDVDSLKKVPKLLTPEDVFSASSNIETEQDLLYLFGEQSPMKDEESGEYILDDDGYLIDEDGKRIVAHNSDGSTVDSDVYEFEKRRQYIDSLDPNGFDFGKNEAEYNGVPVSTIPELNFEKSEIIKKSEPQDWVSLVGSSIRVSDAVLFDENSNYKENGLKIAKDLIRKKIQKQNLGDKIQFKDDNIEPALQVLASEYALEVEGVDNPKPEYINYLLDNMNSEDGEGNTFEDYAVDKIFESRFSGRGVKVRNYNITTPGSSRDYFIGRKATEDESIINDYTIDIDGGSVNIETIAYSKQMLNRDVSKSVVDITRNVIFPQAISGIDNIYGKGTFSVKSDEIRIHAIDTRNNQIATRSDIESKNPNIVFKPFVLGTASSNMDDEDFNKNLAKLESKEEKESYNTFERLLLETKGLKKKQILVPLDEFFNTNELKQFSSVINMAEKLNKKNSSNQEMTQEEMRLIREELGY